ncbi:exonuclease 1-like [Triticum dicoccoides]|uniref:exonuclease 1-like n=1 Tax=Triticum dicoccoides TaxID=85692 RepID=UPI00189055F9|nr:exonuclease 1-like [Triticum dicoccoides]
MGIQGLLPQLKSIMAPIRVEDLRGQTVAVDTYSWLHKGALSCGDRLCKGIPTTRHIEYCMHRVNLLRHHGVKPILVFDGGFLPMKSEQEVKRARSRKENLERAREHEAAGNSRAAFDCYQKAVDITPKIALELIQVLKQEKVDYIVAPYEADAQMTFLSVNKLVDAVITEDSDLIPFGCSRIIFKMDKFGQGVEFQITRLERNRELDLNGFTKQMLLEMCILSGCDYLPSLPGMGVKRAHALIQKLKSHEKVIKHLRYSAVSVPPQYEENFKKAIWAFQFQRVYDPATEDIVHLSGIPHDLSEDDFLGPWLPQAVVKGIALGEIDPLTKEPFEASIPCSAPAADKGYMVKESIIPSNGKKRLELPVQKNILTNYFCLASLEAKRKFRAPKVTPKQKMLNGSSLPSPQTEDSGTPDSIEDTSLPMNNIQFSQYSSEHFSSEPPRDDSIDASQCSTGRAFPWGDSDSVSPHCSSHDIGNGPLSRDQHIEDAEVEVSYCNTSAMPISPCLERTSPGIADLSLVSHNTEPSRPVPHYAESYVAPTVRSSYFKKDKRVFTNQVEDQLDDDDDDNAETGTSTLSGVQPGNPGGVVKRRKLWDPQNFEDETLPPTSSHDSPAVDEGCGTDSLDDIDTNSEGRFGCNVSHVNNYSGIAKKSMDKFAALISSFRYAGSRASGLRAPLKDVKNTLSVRSILRPPEQNLRCTAKKTARGHRSQSRSRSDASNSADGPPDLSAFTHSPVFLPDLGKVTDKDAPARSTTGGCPDQSKNTRKAVGTAVSPDLSTFAYTPTTTASRPERSKFSTAIRTADSPDLSTFAYRPTTTASRSERSKLSPTAIRTADSPPDLITFAYKPMKPLDGSRVAGTTLAASGRNSRGKFT